MDPAPATLGEYEILDSRSCPEPVEVDSDIPDVVMAQEQSSIHCIWVKRGVCNFFSYRFGCRHGRCTRYSIMSCFDEHQQGKESRQNRWCEANFHDGAVTVYLCPACFSISFLCVPCYKMVVQYFVVSLVHRSQDSWCDWSVEISLRYNSDEFRTIQVGADTEGGETLSSQECSRSFSSVDRWGNWMVTC